MVQGQGLLFDKTLKNQYMVTPLIPKQDMQDVTLEVWATIPPEEGVTAIRKYLLQHAKAEAIGKSHVLMWECVY